MEGRETSEVKTKSALCQGFPLPPHTNFPHKSAIRGMVAQVIIFVVCKQMMDFKINPHLLSYSENVKDIIK